MPARHATSTHFASRVRRVLGFEGVLRDAKNVTFIHLVAIEEDSEGLLLPTQISWQLSDYVSGLCCFALINLN